MENEELKNIEATLKFENLELDMNSLKIVEDYLNGNISKEEMLGNMQS